MDLPCSSLLQYMTLTINISARTMRPVVINMWCSAYLPVVLVWAWSRQRQPTRSVFYWFGSSGRQKDTDINSLFESHLSVRVMLNEMGTRPRSKHFMWSAERCLSYHCCGKSVTDLIPSTTRANLEWISTLGCYVYRHTNNSALTQLGQRSCCVNVFIRLL